MSNFYLILLLLLGSTKTQTCQFADECGNYVYECCSCPYPPSLTCSQKASKYCGSNPCPNSTDTTTTETPKAPTAWWVYLLIAIGCLLCTLIWVCLIYTQCKHHMRIRTGKEAEQFSKELQSRQELQQKKRVEKQQNKQQKRKSDRELQKKIYEQRQIQREQAKKHNEKVRAEAYRLYPDSDFNNADIDWTSRNQDRQAYIDRHSINTGCQIM